MSYPACWAVRWAGLSSWWDLLSERGVAERSEAYRREAGFRKFMDWRHSLTGETTGVCRMNPLVAIRAGFIILLACFFAALAIFVILVATLCERAGLNRQRVYIVETVPITLRELLCAIGYYVETHCNLWIRGVQQSNLRIFLSAICYWIWEITCICCFVLVVEE